jgi:hypothetical protein
MKTGCFKIKHPIRKPAINLYFKRKKYFGIPLALSKNKQKEFQ